MHDDCLEKASGKSVLGLLKKSPSCATEKMSTSPSVHTFSSSFHPKKYGIYSQKINQYYSVLTENQFLVAQKIKSK